MVVVHPRPLLDGPLRGDRPYLAINMVATADGRAAVAGTAVGIGSAVDKRLMRELRAEADVVLHGAGTVRADRLSARVPRDLVDQRVAHGLQPQPLGAIVTRSGNLPAQHPYYDSATVVYVTSGGALPVLPVTVDVCQVSGVRAAVEDLQRRGASRVVCEGGPSLNAALLDAGLVDDIFLSIAPKLAGGADPLTIVNGGGFGTLDLELLSCVELAGELLLKYRVGTSEGVRARG